MSRNFQWQTEEEGRWDEPVVGQGLAEARPGRRGCLIPILTLLLVVLGLGGLILQLNRRVGQVGQQTEQDVRSSHALLHEAAEQGDMDLFILLLSGRDDIWVIQQQQLFSEGGVFNRELLGLSLLPNGAITHTRIVSLTLSPDLTSATLLAEQDYAIEIGNGLTETVALQRPMLFRKGPDRWLYAPPQPGFWGEWQNFTTPYLTLIYPSRDAALSRRLLTDLDGKVAALCALLACPAGYQLQLEFSIEPASLTRIHLDSQATIVNQNRYILPSPSSVGLPTNEASYQALYRGYARYVADVVLNQQQFGRHCCQQPAVMAAWRDYLLAQLSLEPWPLTPAGYEQLAAQSLVDLERIWQSDAGSDGPAAHALIEFLGRQLPPHKLSHIVSNLQKVDNYWAWLLTFFPAGSAISQLDQDWQRFLFERAYPNPVAPLPLPAGDAYLLCGAADEAQRLFRYQAEINTMSQLLAGRVFVNILARPGHDALLLVEAYQGDVSRVQIWLWQPDGERLVWDGSSEDYFYWDSRLDPAGQTLQVAYLAQGQNQVHYELVNLADCQNGDCAPRPADGWLSWSPDEQYTLISQLGANELNFSFGDSSGRIIRPLANPNRPFWLTNNTFGYPAGNSILVETIAPPATQTLFSVDQLPLSQTNGLSLLAADGNEHYFWGLVSQGPAAGQHLFVFDRQTDEATIVATLRPETNGQLLPANGQWLLWSELNAGLQTGKLYIYDLSGRDTFTIPLSQASFLTAWSGNWLLQSDGPFLRLLLPNQNYQRTTRNQFAPCHHLIIRDHF